MIGQGTGMDVMGRMNRIGREANSAEWTTCSLKVQLQDETGRAFAGFGAEDCEPIVEDALDAPVRWRGSGDVRSLNGKMVALQFSSCRRTSCIRIRPPSILARGP